MKIFNLSKIHLIITTLSSATKQQFQLIVIIQFHALDVSMAQPSFMSVKNRLSLTTDRFMDRIFSSRNKLRYDKNGKILSTMNQSIKIISYLVDYY